MKRLRDRKDGRVLKDVDPMHIVTPLLYPNRADNEVYMYQKVDATNLLKYVEEYNKDKKDYDKINTFQVLVAVFFKTIYQRDKLNRFIANKTLYERYEHSISFVVKKTFSDDGEEGLAYIRAKDTDNIFTIHQEIKRQVNEIRDTKELDPSSKAMSIFVKTPRFIQRFFTWLVRRWDKKGRVPKGLIESDPYYSTVVISHLGSIGMHSTYHHLTNWGTNSIFVTLGQFKESKILNLEGKDEIKTMFDYSIVIDERLTDGYYLSKTIRLINKLIENPSLLEKQFKEKV